MNELELKYHKYSNGYQRGPIYFMDKFEKLNREEQNLFIDMAIEKELIKALNNARHKINGAGYTAKPRNTLNNILIGMARLKTLTG